MVTIEIDDDIWDAYRRSWALLGVRGHEELVRILEIGLWEESNDVLYDGEKHLLSDEPEALVRRAIGIEKENKQSSHGYSNCL
jgi:hypothetical protein